jgi:hypothetical protein
MSVGHVIYFFHLRLGTGIFAQAGSHPCTWYMKTTWCMVVSIWYMGDIHPMKDVYNIYWRSMGALGPTNVSLSGGVVKTVHGWVTGKIEGYGFHVLR